MSHPPKTTSKLSEKLVQILAHRYFFVAVTALFFLQMAWIALSAIYPMLFDEEYHLGIIEIYSRQISPFITAQPVEAVFHGDITRYSSYFFHYLMSFPYRVISFFTDDLMAKVILLRFICIGLVIGGFIVFRKALLQAGVGRASAHVALLVFTLIPLVPFALAQLNYDALLFVMIPAMLYFTLKARDQNQHQALNLALLLGVGSLASITKFTSLPVFLGCLVFLSVGLWRQHHQKLPKNIFSQYKKTPPLKLVFVSIFLLLGFGLVLERYGVNLATYQRLEPKCDVLHTTDECMQYTVYRRDNTWKAANAAKNKIRENPIEYTTSYWAPHIFNDFFVTGAFVRQDDQANTIRQLPTKLEASSGNDVLRTAGRVVLWASIAGLGVLALRRQLQPKTFFLLVGLVFFIYTTALFSKNYSDYLTIGTPTAAQGRYFIPLLIPILALVVVSLGRVIKKNTVRLGLLLLALVCFSQGGGVANYILYSNQQWYWSEQRPLIEKINADARQTLRRFTLF